MRDGTAKSFHLSCSKAIPSEPELFKVSVEKGGSTILTDGYIVSNDSLSETQLKFLFGLGACLQIMDDIQDIKKDRNMGLMTVFSRYADNFYLDMLTNRTYHFISKVLDRWGFSNGNNKRSSIGLMKKTIHILMIEAIALSSGFYSTTYIRELEAFSPFHFSYKREHESILSRCRTSLIQILGAFI